LAVGPPSCPALPTGRQALAEARPEPVIPSEERNLGSGGSVHAARPSGHAAPHPNRRRLPVCARRPHTHVGPLLIGSAGHGHGAGYLDISVKPSPTVRPRWFILYNGLEPFQHRKWHCRSDVERGVVKWLHMAGGYGRLRYQPWY
jgi:hypothetical protein